MKGEIITGSLLDVLSFVIEIAIMLWFYSDMPNRGELYEKKRHKYVSWFPLLLLLGIYMTPLNATINVFRIENLEIQILRMCLHLLAVMIWLLLNKECDWKRAVYLSALFTAIYLTAQNLRMIMMTYGVVTPSQQTRSFGYVVGVTLVAIIEIILAAVTRRLIRPEKIDNIDKHRAAMMSMILFIMVYFKWILTAIKELSLGGNRSMMVSFSLVTSIGLYLVILFYDYSRFLLSEKDAAEHEKIGLQYEIRSAKRERQAGEDIRRLYHDVKNHLLAIQSMAGSESQVNEYLKELLPMFEGYETQVRTGNQTVDAILSEKIQRAYLDGIKFNICLDLTEINHVRSVDLVTVFGNATDNAIEALRRTEGEERYIYIKSSRFANNLVLRFQNRFEGTVHLKNGKPITVKEDAEMHGIGINSIRSAAARYGGTVHVKADNEHKEFTLVVMLPISDCGAKKSTGTIRT